ncbi:unnamed protein product, partial [Polarella glacialis]
MAKHRNFTALRLRVTIPDRLLLPWLILSKVKGHADAEDIEQQVITSADKEGNHGADLMATDGAKKHRMSPRVLQRFHKLVKNTMWRQVDMIATVLARNDLIKQAGKWNASQHETCDAFGGDEILFDAARVEERDARQIQNAGTFSDKYPGYGWQYPKVGVAHAVNTKPRFHLTARDWGYSVSFHDLLHRYFNGLKWAAHHQAKVSWIELTIDFIAATGCFPYQPGKGKAKQTDKDFLHQVENDLLCGIKAAAQYELNDACEPCAALVDYMNAVLQKGRSSKAGKDWRCLMNVRIGISHKVKDPRLVWLDDKVQQVSATAAFFEGRELHLPILAHGEAGDTKAAEDLHAVASDQLARGEPI